MQTTQTKAYIRWMIRRDLPEVLAIETASFEQCWSERDFLRAISERRTIGMVVEVDGLIVGYVIYQLGDVGIRIANLAVLPTMRREGIGRQLIEKLISKLSVDRRRRIVANICESNLAAQLFLRDCGFKAIKVLKGLYVSTDQDAYVFQYRLRPQR
jgi:ribosomal-protein-alanine N-acetyltransferase